MAGFRRRRQRLVGPQLFGGGDLDLPDGGEDDEAGDDEPGDEHFMVFVHDPVGGRSLSTGHPAGDGKSPFVDRD